MPSFNERLALHITASVATMWAAYVFAGLALIALPQAIAGGPLLLVQWVSQTFIQLVMLSVIMVGQNLQGQASEQRAAAAMAVREQHQTELLEHLDLLLNQVCEDEHAELDILQERRKQDELGNANGSIEVGGSSGGAVGG